MKTKYSFLIIIFLVACYQKKHPITGLEGKPMPTLNLRLMDSVTIINTWKIPSGKPIVLLFISPFCPYCKSQTKEIISNIKNLENVRFYIFSTFPFSSIKQYNEDYQLSKYSNITVGQDINSYFPDAFKVTSIPYIAIYDKNKILKEVHIGEVKANVIKEIAFQ